MRNILVVTGTRAEYGTLKNIMYEICEDNELNLQLIVTGSHLSEKYGYTINDIVDDGFKIDFKVPILMDDCSKGSIAREIGLGIIQFSQCFEKLNPDFLLIMGDRYEIFAAAITAMFMNIPIAHISGGEVTEGAIDEQTRHAITKISHVHFPGAEYYGENIKKMGEEPWRIFNVGDPGIENIKKTDLMTKREIESDLKVKIDKDTLLVTYHPVTLENKDIEIQISNLLQALNILNKTVIMTYPNSDLGSDYIIKELVKFSNENDKIHLFKNLGSRRYLSVMKYCGAVVGNSSSAIIEAPYLRIPAVNIGNRQKGRLKAESIIDCSNDCEDIVLAVNKALSGEFKEKAKYAKSLYGDGNTSKEIVRILKSLNIDEKLLKKKLV